VSLAKLCVLTMLAGGAGGVLGSILGNALGRGGLIAGGVIGGAALVTAAVFFATARGWITLQQRPWTIAGAEAGFLAACLVALSTLGSPIGPIASTVLIGAGAVLGAVLTPQGRGR
jgi:hypothetical protein